MARDFFNRWLKHILCTIPNLEFVLSHKMADSLFQPSCPLPCGMCFFSPQLLHVDMSILDSASSQIDSALKVHFSPASTEHLLVATSANKIVWLSTKTGHVLREVTPKDLVPLMEKVQG